MSPDRIRENPEATNTLRGPPPFSGAQIPALRSRGAADSDPHPARSEADAGSASGNPPPPVGQTTEKHSVDPTGSSQFTHMGVSMVLLGNQTTFGEANPPC